MKPSKRTTYIYLAGAALVIFVLLALWFWS